MRSKLTLKYTNFIALLIFSFGYFIYAYLSNFGGSMDIMVFSF